MVSLEKPQVKAVRIRVQEMDGRKPIKTESITVYNADHKKVFAELEKWVKTSLVSE